MPCTICKPSYLVACERTQREEKPSNAFCSPFHRLTPRLTLRKTTIVGRRSVFRRGRSRVCFDVRLFLPGGCARRRRSSTGVLLQVALGKASVCSSFVSTNLHSKSSIFTLFTIYMYRDVMETMQCMRSVCDVTRVFVGNNC